jgi:hypothetical protein
MEQQKLSPTTVYVLSVLSFFCCCFWGFGLIFGGIAFYIAHSKLKQVQANPEDYEPNSVKAMNTARIVALVILIINVLYLIFALYRVYTIGWDELMEQSKKMMLEFQNS